MTNSLSECRQNTLSPFFCDWFIRLLNVSPRRQITIFQLNDRALNILSPLFAPHETPKSIWALFALWNSFRFIWRMSFDFVPETTTTTKKESLPSAMITCYNPEIEFKWKERKNRLCLCLFCFLFFWLGIPFERIFD